MDGELLSILERIAVSLERLAGEDGRKEKRTPKEALLLTAAYSREERAHREVRQALRPKDPQPQR